MRSKEINENANVYFGVFCGGCPSYYAGTCHGCRSEIPNQKRISKWNCKKRLCCLEKNLYSCGNCSELEGCKIRKNLVKRYIANYNLDLNLNARNLSQLGPAKWLADQISLYKCLKCEGIISPYDGKCMHW